MFIHSHVIGLRAVHDIRTSYVMYVLLSLYSSDFVTSSVAEAVNLDWSHIDTPTQQVDIVSDCYQ